MIGLVLVFEHLDKPNSLQYSFSRFIYSFIFVVMLKNSKMNLSLPLSPFRHFDGGAGE